MKEELVSFKTAKLAKEKGFTDWSEKGEMCLIKSKNKTSSYLIFPTQSLLQKFIREKHSMDIVPIPSYTKDTTWSVQVEDFTNMENGFLLFDSKTEYSTYEEVIEEGLFQALKLIE